MTSSPWSTCSYLYTCWTSPILTRRNNETVKIIQMSFRVVKEDCWRYLVTTWNSLSRFIFHNCLHYAHYSYPFVSWIARYMRDWGQKYFLFPYCTNTNKILHSLMFLLLRHPLDSWKVAMIFVGNIINRVTFLFSLLFSFYWSCQKFSSSCCWRIIALSWCQIKLAKCLNLSISADLISLSRAGQLTAAAEVWVRARANPLISAGDDHWAPPPSPPAPIQHMVRNGQRVWPSPPHPVIHAAQNGLLPNPNEVVIDDILSAQYIFSKI